MCIEVDRIDCDVLKKNGRYETTNSKLRITRISLRMHTFTENYSKHSFSNLMLKFHSFLCYLIRVEAPPHMCHLHLTIICEVQLKQDAVSLGTNLAQWTLKKNHRQLGVAIQPKTRVKHRLGIN